MPLRKRVVPALVINSKDVEDSKTEIKNSSFPLKKIEKVKYVSLLSKNFVEAAEITANYFVGSTGSVLNSIIPKVLLEHRMGKKGKHDQKNVLSPICKQLQPI